MRRVFSFSGLVSVGLFLCLNSQAVQGEKRAPDAPAGQNQGEPKLVTATYSVAELATLNGHTDGVNCVVFSPDGNSLASGSVGKTIKLWDIPAREAARPKKANAPDEAKGDTAPPTTRAENRRRFFRLPDVRFTNTDGVFSSDYIFEKNPDFGFLGDKGLMEHWDITVSPTTKVTIDGKEARFADLKALVDNPNPEVSDNGEVVIVKCELELTAVSDGDPKRSKGSALRLDARGQRTNALLQSVNIGQSTLTARMSGLEFDELFRAGLDVLAVGEPAQVQIAKDAVVFVDGKDAKLADLKPNMRMFLQEAARKNVALSISAFGVRVQGEVQVVDQEMNAIRIHIPRLQMASGAVPVAKDAKILLDGAPAKLADLAPGMRVMLQMSAAREESLIVGITAEK